MKILVTGATGFFGQHIARRLQNNGHQVSALGRNETIGKQLQEIGLTFVKADLSDRAKILAVCRDQEIVVHSGALAAPWGPYQKFYSTNVTGTENILASCQKNSVRRLVVISTPSVYFDFRHRLNISESEPLPKKQFTHYAATKLLADELVEGVSAPLETISIRPRAIFGAGDETVLGRLLRLATSGSITTINGGSSYVDMTYIDNAVDAVELCIAAPTSALRRVYNISNGEPTTVRSLLSQLFAKLNLNIKFRSLPFPLAYCAASVSETFASIVNNNREPSLTRYAVGLMARSQTLDISAARNILGYRPRVSLDEGLTRYASWWKETHASH